MSTSSAATSVALANGGRTILQDEKVVDVNATAALIITIRNNNSTDTGRQPLLMTMDDYSEFVEVTEHFLLLCSSTKLPLNDSGIRFFRTRLMSHQYREASSSLSYRLDLYTHALLHLDPTTGTRTTNGTIRAAAGELTTTTKDASEDLLLQFQLAVNSCFVDTDYENMLQAHLTLGNPFRQTEHVTILPAEEQQQTTGNTFMLASNDTDHSSVTLVSWLLFLYFINTTVVVIMAAVARRTWKLLHCCSAKVPNNTKRATHHVPTTTHLLSVALDGGVSSSVQLERKFFWTAPAADADDDDAVVNDSSSDSSTVVRRGGGTANTNNQNIQSLQTAPSPSCWKVHTDVESLVDGIASHTLHPVFDSLYELEGGDDDGAWTVMLASSCMCGGQHLFDPQATTA